MVAQLAFYRSCHMRAATHSDLSAPYDTCIQRAIMQGLTSTLCCICTKGCAELPCCSGSGSFLKAQETRDTLRYHSMLHRRQADGCSSCAAANFADFDSRSSFSRHHTQTLIPSEPPYALVRNSSLTARHTPSARIQLSVSSTRQGGPEPIQHACALDIGKKAALTWCRAPNLSQHDIASHKPLRA